MKRSSPEHPPAQYLALGDSYTIGEGVAESERWPVQLVRLLREAGLHIAEPQIIARTGWTTDELAEALDHALLEPSYDLVSLLIGVNNQYRDRTASEYREQFTSLLHRATSFAHDEPGRVLVLSIPDWGRTPFAADRDVAAITAGIDVFNQVNRTVTQEAGALYVDITAATRALGTGTGAVVADRLHPSGTVYEMWARHALAAALSVLHRHR